MLETRGLTTDKLSNIPLIKQPWPIRIKLAATTAMADKISLKNNHLRNGDYLAIIAVS